MILPGWPVPVFGGRLRDGYSLREDTSHAYLIYGAEEVVHTFPPTVRVREIEDVMHTDWAERCAKASAMGDRGGELLGDAPNEPV